MPFAKGQSGNPGGRATEQAYTQALRAAVNVIDPKKKRRRLELIAECAAVDAYEGEPQIRATARQHIADRLDGKAHQTSDVSVSHQTVAEMTRDQLLRIAAQEVVEAETKH